METTYCPACGGDSALLGFLGNRAHFRCIGCGMDHSAEVDAEDVQDAEE